jgi:sucrose-6-phosphate hydrolase SacC (GH32 family)
LLRQTPHPVIERLCRPLTTVPSIQLEGDAAHELDGISEKSLRLRATFRRGESKSVSLFLRRDPQGREQTEIRYEWGSELLTLDRSKSSLDPLVKRDLQVTTYAPVEKDLLHLDVFVDRSVLEVFVDDRAAFAARIYPTLSTSGGVGFASAGAGATVENVSVARLEPFEPSP